MRYAAIAVIAYFIVRITYEPHLLMVYMVVPISLVCAIFHVLSHAKVNYKQNGLFNLPVSLALTSNILFVSLAFHSIDFSHLYLVWDKYDLPLHTPLVIFGIVILDIFLIVFLPSTKVDSKSMNW
jgi:hypothetical protein